MFCALGLISANAAVTQVFTKGIGLPDEKGSMPTQATAYTATDTNIKYTLLYAYANDGYLMLNGKDNAGAFVSFALDFDCTSIDIATTSGCSTNANNKLNFYVNDNLVKEGVAINVQNATVNVAVPEQYQKSGNVYKLQYDKPASGNAVNSQIASMTYYGVGETPEAPVDPTPGETTIYTVKEALALITGGTIPSGNVQVKGIISAIDEISAQYGNATYDIKDALTDADALKVFRGKWLEGANFTGNEIAIGGTVVVEGTLVYYNNVTPEVNTGNKVISYTAPSTPVDPNPGTGEYEDGKVTYDATKQGYANQQEITTVTLTPITLTFDGGGNNNSPKYYTASPAAIRMYPKNTLTVSSINNSDITKIEIGFSANYGDGENKEDVYFMADGYSNGTWQGNATSVVLTVNPDAASGQVRVQTITVTYGEGAEIKVMAPVVTCENNLITMTCATEGAEIYYDLTGADPTNNSMKYTAPIAINETVLVKAIAYKGTDASTITTYTANYVEAYDGFEAFIAANATAGGTVNGPITTVYQNGSYLYVVDSKDYPMLVYGTTGLGTYNNGDQLASITGKYSPYNNLPEMVPSAVGALTTGGTPVQPAEMTIEEVGVDIINSYVKFNDITLTSDSEMKDETGSIVLFKRFTGVNIPTDYTATYTVIGFVSIYGETIQIYPTEFIVTGEGEGGGQGGETDSKSKTLNVNDATNIDGTFVEEKAPEGSGNGTAAHYQPLNSLMLDAFRLDFTTTNENASSQPAYYYAMSTNTNQQKTIRIYNGTSMTITAPSYAKMLKVEFAGSNLGNNAAFTVDKGEITTANNAVWTCNEGANSFTLTTNASWRITGMTITTDVTVGVSDVTVENDANAPVEYYNLQGVRVDNPAAGQLVIRRQGNTVTKMVVR